MISYCARVHFFVDKRALSMDHAFHRRRNYGIFVPLTFVMMAPASEEWLAAVGPGPVRTGSLIGVGREQGGLDR
ncbi:hypothetical protein D3C72_2042230 [compost metagenome]